MKTKIEIINDTVEFYSKNPRSIENGFCVYNSTNGRRCAVSRCCYEDSVFVENWPIKFVPIREQGHVVKFLPEYQGHGISFWGEIQKIHDGPDFWNEMEFTASGIAYANALKTKYA